MKEIAEKLKSLRLANWMMLKQLANKAGCIDAYLSQLEKERANLSIMMLKKIASALEEPKFLFFIPGTSWLVEPWQKEGDCDMGSEPTNFLMKKVRQWCREVKNQLSI